MTWLASIWFWTTTGDGNHSFFLRGRSHLLKHQETQLVWQFEVNRSRNFRFTHSPPVSKMSQASAWYHKYTRRWMGQTEVSPSAGLARNYKGRVAAKKTSAKVIDLVPLERLSGPEPPDLELARMLIRAKQGILEDMQ